MEGDCSIYCPIGCELSGECEAYNKIMQNKIESRNSGRPKELPSEYELDKQIKQVQMNIAKLVKEIEIKKCQIK